MIKFSEEYQQTFIDGLYFLASENQLGYKDGLSGLDFCTVGDNLFLIRKSKAGEVILFKCKIVEEIKGNG